MNSENIVSQLRAIADAIEKGVLLDANLTQSPARQEGAHRGEQAINARIRYLPGKVLALNEEA